MEKMNVSGVARDNNVARIAIIGLQDEPGVAYRIFSLMAKANINVDIILQSIGRDSTKDISFTVPRDHAHEALQVLEENKESLHYEETLLDEKVAKVSIVGAGMINNSGVASKMFEALGEAHVNINMISTSEIKISVLIDENDSERAVKAIHRKFFD